MYFTESTGLSTTCEIMRNRMSSHIPFKQSGFLLPSGQTSQPWRGSHAPGPQASQSEALIQQLAFVEMCQLGKIEQDLLTYRFVSHDYHFTHCEPFRAINYFTILNFKKPTRCMTLQRLLGLMEITRVMCTCIPVSVPIHWNCQSKIPQLLLPSRVRVWPYFTKYGDIMNDMHETKAKVHHPPHLWVPSTFLRYQKTNSILNFRISISIYSCSRVSIIYKFRCFCVCMVCNITWNNRYKCSRSVRLILITSMHSTKVTIRVLYARSSCNVCWYGEKKSLQKNQLTNADTVNMETSSTWNSDLRFYYLCEAINSFYQLCYDILTLEWWMHKKKISNVLTRQKKISLHF